MPLSRTTAPESKFAKRDYKLGDVNTTVIRTAKGKTIMVQHDVSNPRPYSRIHQVVGTRGFAQKYPIEQIGLDSVEAEGLDAKALADLLTRYEHPISKEYGEKARAVGGHGGMDFIMDSRLIYCLRNGLPLDQDVYDAAEWSSLGRADRSFGSERKRTGQSSRFHARGLGQSQRFLVRLCAGRCEIESKAGMSIHSRSTM